MTRLAGILLCFTLAVSTAHATEETFGGVGLQVVPTATGELVVLNVLDGAPAAEKGILPGDLIYKVDNFLLQGSEFGKVISEYLWGPVGSSVVVFYRRPGVSGESRVVVKRSEINPRLTVTPTVQGGAAEDNGSQ